MAHPGGRPTKYNDKMLERARAYVAGGWKRDGERVPKIASLAVWLGVNKTTLYEWEAAEPEFSNVLGELRAIQERLLVDNGLGGDYNPTIAKLLLHKHGYHDKVDQSVSPGKGVTFRLEIGGGDE